MTPERWQQVKAIFQSALEQQPGERSQFLVEACAGDTALHEEVSGLLAALDDTHSILDQPPLALAWQWIPAAGAAPLADPLVGRRMGSYRLVRLIGRGGMGAVYEAERCDEQYQQRVAVKLVRPEMNVAELLPRFRRERQVLANLDHPAIARLLDGGITQDGLPYLVMEYVEGVRIDAYCASHGLPTRERLDLFRKVCEAVTYAHRKLIVHRDLKPGNILATAEGQPKLLDFGIAKLLRDADARDLTLTGQRAMTPEYASPEQIRGEEIGPASDVYALGVLLYELLTGHYPYGSSTGSAADLERAVCHEEPPKPSAAVALADNPAEATSDRAAGETSAQRLRHDLSGDLDNIVLMAMCKEPSRRYLSVEDFSADILRHLEGKPVIARPRTLRYRAAKLIKRRRTEAIAVVLLVLTLAGGILAGRWFGAVRTPARPAIAVLGFKDLGGRAEPWLSTALAEMLTNTLAAGEKLRAIPGEEIARMKKDLALPDASAYGKATLARIRRYLGADDVVLGSYLVQPADGQIRLDLNLQDAARGGMTTSISETGNRANLSALVTRVGAGLRARLGIEAVSPREAAAVSAAQPSNPEALKYYAEGLEKLRQADNLAARHLLAKAVAANPDFPLAHTELAAAWSGLGFDAQAQAEARKAFELSGGLSREDRLSVEGRYRELMHEWPRAIEIYHALWDFFPDNLNYGLRLASAQISTGKAKEALATVGQLRKLPPPAGDDPHIDLAEANAATSLSDFQGEQAAAARAALKAQAEGAQLLLARARILQGGAMASLGERQKAAAFLDEARQLYQRSGDKAGVAAALNNLGNIPYGLGDFEKARQCYQGALSIYREIGDRRHSVSALNNLASAVADQGDLAASRKMREESLAIAREIGNRMAEAVILGNIGNLFYFEGDLPGARTKYEESIALRQQLGAVSSGPINLNNLGMVLRRLGELREAAKQYEESAGICRTLNNQEQLMYALIGLGQVLYDEGNLPLSRKNEEEAMGLAKQFGEKTSAAKVNIVLAALSTEEGDPAAAGKLARDAAVMLRDAKQNDDSASAYTVLAEALLAEQKPQDALAAIEEGRSLLISSGDPAVRLSAAISAARVRAAVGKPEEAERILNTSLAEAAKYRMTGMQLEAGLALAEIGIHGGRSVASRARLAQIERRAQQAGFGLIAREAGALRLSGTPQTLGLNPPS